MHIGAAVTHRRLERSTDVAEHLPLLHQAAARVANMRVRNGGTLGGNLRSRTSRRRGGDKLISPVARVPNRANFFDQRESHTQLHTLVWSAEETL